MLFSLKEVLLLVLIQPGYVPLGVYKTMRRMNVSSFKINFEPSKQRLPNVDGAELQKRNIPRPREATSVAIRIGERPDLNSPSTQSRSRLNQTT